MTLKNCIRRDSLKALAALGAVGTVGGWSSLVGVLSPNPRNFPGALFQPVLDHK